jgi:hypothetical protein
MPAQDTPLNADASEGAALPEVLPDPFQQDVSPWLLRRLRLAENLADQVRANAQAVLAELDASSPPTPTRA